MKKERADGERAAATAHHQMLSDVEAKLLDILHLVNEDTEP